MRIAFYAPLKAPDHGIPSGDRTVARLLVAALKHAGHQVELASRLRSRDGAGDPVRQRRLAALGARLAARLLRRYEARPPAARPRAWLTYHLYYKAPDWIGPRVCRALGIPYVVAEASLAAKRADGPWAMGHEATLAALSAARAVIALNSADVPALPAGTPMHRLAPFLDPAPYRAAHESRASTRAQLAMAHGLDPTAPWLLSAAMMRADAKLASYRCLGAALRQVADRPWHLLIAGDGPARAAVRAAFAWAETGRVVYLGMPDEHELPEIYGACDLYAWPAVNEAYGMALLEAQAAGLPVLAGAAGGVASVVGHGETGVLVPPGDERAFAQALGALLDDPSRRRALGAAALKRVAARHGLDRAARDLDAIFSAAGLRASEAP